MKSRVLIVDDSLTVRMDLGEAFERAGYAATLCSTAAEARRAFSPGSFALVLLDVHLPDGDGVDLLREFKSVADTSEVTVMMLSSEAEVQDRIRGLRTGADEYVGKPYDQSWILARARELLRGQTPGNTQSESAPILIIDDSPTFREELKSALETAGHAVITAENGEEGIRMAVDERPAAIVVDGVLPGIDGATVIRRIRADAALRSTPCVLLTGSEESGGEIAALDSGADDYLLKEMDIRVILARLAALLRTAGTAPASPSTRSLLGPRKILAVDDNPGYLEVLAARLREDGYDVIAARSGEEALDLLAVQPVDCILLDQVMPGLSGLETCRRIRDSAAWRDIPLVLHSAVDEPAAIIDGINAGADDFVPKLGNFEVLRARVRAQLRRKQFEDEKRSIREQLLQKELETAAASAARELAEERARFIEELEHKNRELESFGYSISHDLRAPLRAIAAFSQILAEDYREKLDPEAQSLLDRIQNGASQMGKMIEALLGLSRVARGELSRDDVNLSNIVRDILGHLRATRPDRQAEFVIAPDVVARGDFGLLRIVLENLLGNAWKFTTKQVEARIEFGVQQRENQTVYFVRDNGAGFEMKYAGKLFGAFQRLHAESDFAGTGIGLATVARAIHRHGGRVWADSELGKGATFFFTLESRIGWRPQTTGLPVQAAG